MRVLRTCDTELWLEVAARSEQATFFHTPHWSSLVVATYPEYHDTTVGAELPEGARVVLPLLETGRSGKGLLRHLVSTFGGCYGGLIADTPLPPARQAEIYTALLGRLRVGSLQMTESPLAEESGTPARFDTSPYSTQLVALEEGWEMVQRRFSRGNLSSINRGRRLGVTSRLATSLDDYRAYYDVYERSLERWGERATSRYPWRLFENGCDLGRRYPDHLKLWLAGNGDQVMAGAWVFYWNRHAVYWHGATDVGFSACRPANVLHADVIQDACARGYRHYDLNPSGGHEGVARFKSSFGAAIRPIRVWNYQSAAADVLDSVRRLIR